MSEREKHAMRLAMKKRINTQHKFQSHSQEQERQLYILRKSLIWKQAQVVCMFWPMPSEVDTRPLVTVAHDYKKSLWLPLPNKFPLYMRSISRISTTPSPQRYLYPGAKAMRLHTPHSQRRGCRCHRNRLCNHKKLSIATWLKYNAHKPMLIIVPGLAFSPCGMRLGRGTGFYDKLLAILKGHGNAFYTVGLCYEVQLTHSMPFYRHDKRLTHLITEERLFHCKSISRGIKIQADTQNHL